jgi:hypothetical protein
MELTIKPTEQFFMAGDVMVRMWQGTNQDGTPVVAFVSLVTFPGQAEAASENLVPIPLPDAADAQRWAHVVMARGFNNDDGLP